jgi:hypothetical protein
MSAMHRIGASARWLLVLLPFVVLYSNRNVAMWWDVNEFHDWFEQSRLARPQDGRSGFFSNLYRASACNYPALGAILSAGAMGALSRSEDQTQAQRLRSFRSFRLVLACFEALSLYLSFLLLDLLSGQGAWSAAVALYLLPSSWAGGATWGQIDIINHCSLLLAAYCSVRLIVKTPQVRSHCVGLALAGLVSIITSVLIKQLSLFTVPGLLALWLTALLAVSCRHGWRDAVRAALVAAAVGLVYFWTVDRGLFLLPGGSSGTLDYVLKSGSGHIGKLSRNGPNLWTFLPREGSSSSSIPFYDSLTPLAAGLGLYALLLAFLTLLLFLHLLRLALDRDKLFADSRSICAFLLFYTGMGHLMMGIFITGTHERHLYHAFPFLVMASYVSWKRGFSDFLSRNFFLVCLTSFFYGTFVYSIINTDAFSLWFPLKSQAFVAAFILFLFVRSYGGFVIHFIKSLGHVEHVAP